MRNILDTVSTLTKLSKDDLIEILKTLQLSSILNYINSSNNEIEIPEYGKLLVDKDFNIEFIPDPEFKKQLYNAQKDPNHYLKNELKKLLNIEEYVSE